MCGMLAWCRLWRRVFVLFLGCAQHQCGLVAEPVSKALDVISPSFCTVKQLHKGNIMNDIEKELFRIMDAKLQRVTDAEPFVGDVIYANQLLEVCYYDVDVRSPGISTKDRQQFEEDGRLRRAEGLELRKCLSGNWRKAVDDVDGCLHHCFGCCANREESVQKVVLAFMAPLETARRGSCSQQMGPSLSSAVLVDPLA